MGKEEGGLMDKRRKVRAEEREEKERKEGRMEGEYEVGRGREVGKGEKTSLVSSDSSVDNVLGTSVLYLGTAKEISILPY